MHTVLVCALLSVVFLLEVEISFGANRRFIRDASNSEYDEDIYGDNPFKRDFNSYSKICSKKIRSDMLSVAALFIGPDGGESGGERAPKCWIGCIMEKFKFLQRGTAGRGAELQEAVMMRRTEDLTPSTRTKLQKYIKTCRNAVSQQKDICEISFGFVKCMFDNLKVRKKPTAKRQDDPE